MHGAARAVRKLPRLREVRESHFLTQGELGARSGLSRQTICRIEQDVIKPRFRTIRQIAAALGVEPRELAGKQS